MKAPISTYGKRILFLFLFLLTISWNRAYSQELLVSILDSLQADSTPVSTIVEQDSCNYFDNMANKKNFRFRDKDMVYINSYKHYSMYLMVSQDRLSKVESYQGLQSSGVKLAVLFDTKLQRCYYFKYSMTLWFDFQNKEANTALIDAEFTRNIQYIVELDKQFDRIWGISIFVTRNQVGTNISERGDLRTYLTFFLCLNSICFKSKSLLERNLNIANITYQELNDRFGINQVENDSIDSPVGKIDPERLFTGSLPGF
ncbi:hypothetical protein IR022_13025 [Dysgonomonas sp. GY617]|nr:hypothetical protein [Dysgonomonas sp. GY617]